MRRSTWPIMVGMLLALAVSVAMAATGIVDGSAGEQAFLEWLKAAGFPAWAVILLAIGRMVLRRFDKLGATMQRHIVLTERRLARLEAGRGLRVPAESGNDDA